MTKTELNPPILIPNSQSARRRLSVTTTIDNTTEKVILSMTLIRRKKMRVQAKPGRKNRKTDTIIALIMGKLSRKGKTDPTSPMIGDNQSMPCFPLPHYLAWVVYDFTQYSQSPSIYS